jgi:RNA polymerase sigma factor (sigma-70 family)
VSFSTEIDASKTNEGLLEGDFVQAYSANYQKCFRLAFQMLKSHEIAEDLTQTVFLKLWIKRSSFSEIEDISLYLFRMVHNESINHLRKKLKRRKIFQHLAEPSATMQNITESIIHKRQLEILWQEAIRKLSRQRKKVYILSQLEGWQVEKIANVLSIAIPTVKETLKQAKRLVRDYISVRTDCSYREKSALNKISYLLQEKSSEAA